MSKCDLTAIFTAAAYTAADFHNSTGINGILIPLNRIGEQHLREKTASYSRRFFVLCLVPSKRRTADSD